MGTIAGHAVTTFTTPTNGTSPIDANVVKGNDNTIKTAYNAHDADATIHLQSGLLAGRPVAGTAQATWLTTDTGSVRLYLDTGSVWVEASYLPLAGGTLTGTVTGTSASFSNTVNAVTLAGSTGPASLAGYALFPGTAGPRLAFGADDSGYKFELSKVVSGVTTNLFTVPDNTAATLAKGLTITTGGFTMTAGVAVVGAMANTNATDSTLCLSNTTAPSGSPIGGGFLYVVAGQLRYRGSSGTITVLGNA